MIQQRQRGIAIPHLAAWREFRNKTRNELAGLIGVNPSVISRVENGGHCEFHTAKNIAVVLALTPQQLLYETPWRDDIPRTVAPYTQVDPDVALRLLDGQLAKQPSRKMRPVPSTPEELLAEVARQAERYGLSGN